MAYVPASDEEYRVQINNIAVLGSKVVPDTNSDIAKLMLHHLQTLYSIERQREQQMGDMKKRLDRMENALRRAGVLLDDGYGNPGGYDFSG